MEGDPNCYFCGMAETTDHLLVILRKLCGALLLSALVSLQTNIL
jgi:hypothetical protein